MKKKSSILVILIVIAIIGFVWWANGSSPVDKKNTSPQLFNIPKGEGIKQIAKNLKLENLIKDTTVFFLILKSTGLDKKIQAGDFQLNQSMSSYEIAENLTHGTADIWVTIPEGERAEEIADTLQKNIPTYEESWRPVLVRNEGYLFPDTYLVPR